MTDMELAELERVVNSLDTIVRRGAWQADPGLTACVMEFREIIAALRRVPEPLQDRVAPWMQACFGPEISSDKTERNHRFVEESLELAQANGCTMSEAHQLVDYVFHRPAGDAHQECGGVLITLAALCLARGLDMAKAGEDELARIWKKIDVIRKKQAAKPPHSPLPERPPSGEMVMVRGMRLADEMVDAMNQCRLSLEGSARQAEWREAHDKARRELVALLSAAEAEGRKP